MALALGSWSLGSEVFAFCSAEFFGFTSAEVLAFHCADVLAFRSAEVFVFSSEVLGCSSEVGWLVGVALRLRCARFREPFTPSA